MFRLLAPILIVAVSGFGSNPGHYDRQHCVDAPAQEVAAYTASLGGGAGRVQAIVGYVLSMVFS